MATRAGRKIDPCRELGRGGEDIAPFLSILCNNIQIFGPDVEDVPPGYIIRTLVTRGAIAFWRAQKTWCAYIGAGRATRTGFPKMVKLLGDNGKMSEALPAGDKKDADICIVPANAFFYPPMFTVRDKVDSLHAIEDALGQNLNALKQATAIIYEDPDLKSQIEDAERKRLSGCATVSIRKKIGQELQIEAFSPNATSYIADFLALWTNTIEELDEATGRVKIGEKSERRTDDEITVIENSASSAIDTIIDTFNNMCKWYGINARAERGSEIRYKAAKAQNEEEPETDTNEPLKGKGEAENGNE